MSNPLESAFQKKVKAFLDALPYTCYTKVQQQSKNGDPDIIACIRGRSFYLELKRKGKKARALQEFILRKHVLSGGYSFDLSPKNSDIVFQFLDEIAYNKPITNPYENLPHGINLD